MTRAGKCSTGRGRERVEGRAGQLAQSDELTPVRELGLWLCALRSFFDTANHPLSEDERASLPARSFNCETRVTRDALLRCLSLVGGVERGEQPHVSPDAAGDAELWRQIFVSNRESLLAALAQFDQRLAAFRVAIEQRDEAMLLNLLIEAKERRDAVC